MADGRDKIPPAKRPLDDVDRLRARISKVYPRVDTRPLAITARMKSVLSDLETRLDDLHAPAGLRGLDFEILRILRLSPNREVPFSALVDELDLTTGNMSHHVKRLERAKFIQRCASSSDHRQRALVLTPDGAAYVDRHMSDHLDLHARLLRHLDPVALRSLAQVLLKLSEPTSR